MTKIGYARVSSTDQDCSIQVEALEAAGCNVIRSEQITGTRTDGRKELALCLQLLQPGDTLVVTRIDRLARSLADLLNIVTEIKDKGADLHVIQQPMDTSGPHGKLMMQMLGAFAEFETAIRKERQLEGIAKAKAAGVYKGRKPSVPVDEIVRLRSDGMKPSEISRRLGVGRTSVYRALGMVA